VRIRVVLVGVDDPRVESPLEEVPDADVPPVEALCVEAVQPLHADRQLGLRRLDEQVKVVVEERPRVQPPGMSPDDVLQAAYPPMAVGVVLDDRALLDAAGRHEIDGRARQEAAWHSRHRASKVRPT
jgi:hypothetical protein